MKNGFKGRQKKVVLYTWGMDLARSVLMGSPSLTMEVGRPGGRDTGGPAVPGGA